MFSKKLVESLRRKIEAGAWGGGVNRQLGKLKFEKLIPFLSIKILNSNLESVFHLLSITF